jgi:superfamily II DNA/RNA helicase
VSQASPKHPTGLVLVPTRELAEQVQRAFVPLGRAQWRFVQAVYGGAPMAAQVHSLRKGASVVVATPGRLLDLIEQGHCDLGAVEVCVIDEADRMADLGFMPDVKRILDMTPTTRQTMLWSATLDGDVDELIKTYLNDPAMHDLVGEVEQGTVEHRFVVQPAMQRLDATVELLGTHGPTVMFVKTRFGVDDVVAELMNAGIRAGALHGARTQQARTRTLEDFKRGKVQVLVATDVAARGIHVDDVELVVHYDLPDNDKDYQHRSGRTGRAGRDGTVVAFVPPSRKRVARRIVDALEHEVNWVEGSRPAPRPDRTGREAEFEGAGRSDRDERPRSFDRDDRPRSYDARGPRSDRPAYGDRPRGDRNDRPGYGDRTRSDRPTGDRPAYGDRPRGDRNERPAYGDRSRSDRPTGDRPAYGDRARGPRDGAPTRSDRSSARSFERLSSREPRTDDRTWTRDDTRDGRSDRPDRNGRRADRDARFERSTGGAPRGDRAGGPARSWQNDRPARPAGERADRFGGSARPPRAGEARGRSDRPTTGGRAAGPVRRPR